MQKTGHSSPTLLQEASPECSSVAPSNIFRPCPLTSPFSHCSPSSGSPCPPLWQEEEEKEKEGKAQALFFSQTAPSDSCYSLLWVPGLYLRLPVPNTPKGFLHSPPLSPTG